MKQKSKASVLVVSLIILGVILLIAISISSVSVQERKASMSSSHSSQAYQVAESGVEDVLERIKDNSGDANLNNIDNDGTCNGTFNSPNGYKVELKDSNGAILPCNSPVSAVQLVKSTGTAGQDKRAIEAAVAQAGSDKYQTSCASGQSTIYCCSVDQTNGDTVCRGAGVPTGVWGNLPSPFSAGTTGRYNITFIEADYWVVCQTNALTRATVCKYLSGGNWVTFPNNPW